MVTNTYKSKNISHVTQGYLICIVGTILWSSAAVFIRYLTEAYQLPPLLLAFWRDSIVFIGLASVFAITSPRRLKLDRRHLRFIILYGLVLSLFNALWTISVALNGAAVSTVLVYSSTGFTALLGWRLFGERLGPVKILAVMLSLLGCALVSGALDPTAWQLNPLGVITGLLSGIAFAGYSLMGKASSERQIGSWNALLYTFAFAALFLLAYNMLPGWLPEGLASRNLLWLGDSLTGWGILILLALVPTVGGYGLYTLSLDYLPASVANIIATLEPAMTAVLAFLFLGELLTTTQLGGSILIICGVIMLRIREDRTTASTEVQELAM